MKSASRNEIPGRSKESAADTEVGDIAEFAAGPFEGEKARIVRMDKRKGNATVELFEAGVPTPATVSERHIRTSPQTLKGFAPTVEMREKSVRRVDRGR